GDQQEPLIALTDFTEDALEGQVVRVVALDGATIAVIPLVVGIVIDAQYVEVLRRAAQTRPALAAEHVPGLELRLAKSLGLTLRAGAVIGCDDVDGRIDLDEARPWLHVPNRLHGCDGGAHQLMLEFEATTSRHRIEIGLVTAGPGPERDLVERRIEGHRIGFILDQLRHRRCVAGEAFDELRTPDVYIVRPAIVAKVPDHLGALTMGGLQHRQKTRPIVLARRPDRKSVV